MTVKDLKAIIKSLPNDMEVWVTIWDAEYASLNVAKLYRESIEPWGLQLIAERCKASGALSYDD